MRVWNKREQNIPSGAVYVGRPSEWGNPFEIGKHGTRADVIRKYRSWLWQSIEAGEITLEGLAALAGKDLMCWCAPLPCHADVLEKAARWAMNELAQSEHDRKFDV